MLKSPRYLLIALALLLATLGSTRAGDDLGIGIGIDQVQNQLGGGAPATHDLLLVGGGYILLVGGGKIQCVGSC